jgi:glycosyltransferase involved in cell wall biosynthesis
MGGTEVDGPEVTVLMPCLNEAETLEFCIREAQEGLAKCGRRGEVLIADNGSTDGSRELAERLGARVVPVAARGYGNALRGGIRAARGKWVLMGDCDGSYDFSDQEKFWRQLESGADLVMGCRMPWGGGTVQPGAMPLLHRWLGNPVLTFLGRLFFGAPVHDFHCGLRAFRREAMLGIGLQTGGMEFASEMVILSCLGRLKIREVPTVLRPDRRNRPPHLRTWRDGWRHLRFMLLFSPRWVFFMPGLFLLLAGLLVGGPLSFGPLVVGPFGFDVNTLLMGWVTWLAGVQLVIFGLFTRTWASRAGWLPEQRSLAWFYRHFTLERGLLLGLLCVAVGNVLLVCSLASWHALGWGVLSFHEGLRRVIPAAGLILTGFMVFFSSFALSMLSIERAQHGEGTK